MTMMTIMTIFLKKTILRPADDDSDGMMTVYFASVIPSHYRHHRHLLAACCPSRTNPTTHTYIEKKNGEFYFSFLPSYASLPSLPSFDDAYDDNDGNDAYDGIFVKSDFATE